MIVDYPQRYNHKSYIRLGIIFIFFLFAHVFVMFGANPEFPSVIYEVQDTFPIIFIDTTESEEAVEFTTGSEFSFDTISATNSINEFEKKLGKSGNRRTGSKGGADRRSNPYIVNGEVVASVYVEKKRGTERLWKEIDPAEEIRRQLENNKMLLERYEKNLKVAQSIKNDRLVDAMNVKIDYTKDRIKDQKRALRKVK